MCDGGRGTIKGKVIKRGALHVGGGRWEVGDERNAGSALCVGGKGLLKGMGG